MSEASACVCLTAPAPPNLEKLKIIIVVLKNEDAGHRELVYLSSIIKASSFMISFCLSTNSGEIDF